MERSAGDGHDGCRAPVGCTGVGGLIAAVTGSAHPIAFLFALALIGILGFVGEWGLSAPPMGRAEFVTDP